jgi:carbamate kinase
MRIVISVGGHALPRRRQGGQPPHPAPFEAPSTLDTLRYAAIPLAAVAAEHELVVVHGQGLLGQSLLMPSLYPLDMVGAENEGRIGYLLEQEIANRLPAERAVATLLTRVEVRADDPAFADPAQAIGPVHGADVAQRLRTERGWVMAMVPTMAVGEGSPGFRRLVPSPEPLAVVDARPVEWLLERGAVVLCGGGGGIPVVARHGGYAGVEAVIDPDACASLLARRLDADLFIIATDVEAVMAGWRGPEPHALGRITSAELRALAFEPGTMRPKVSAACAFADALGRAAAIGSLARLAELVSGEAGTRVLPV